jgi:CMP-N,N'-diacetyllegionaminic acid synthase
MITIDGKKRNLLAWIPARGGTKGLPGKALRDLGGKPVIAHTIEYALSVAGMDRVIVNTDDEQIREIARKHGAEVPFLRPFELAQDHSSLENVLDFQWQWLKEHENFEPEVHIGMSPTHPLRAPGRIDHALELAMADVNMVNIRSVAPVSSLADNYWVQSKTGMQQFCFDQNVCHLKRTIYKNLFSFNVVLECRRHLFHDAVWRQPAPYPLTPTESIDLDETKDLAMARVAISQPFEFNGPVSGDPDEFTILNKRIAICGSKNTRRIFKHPDFPCINAAEVQMFKEMTHPLKIPAMTGCLVDDDVHPYRLLMENEFYRLVWAVDISQKVRGSRQAYPRVYRFVPALLSLPPGTDDRILQAMHNLALVQMSRTKLLDITDPLDRLLIDAAKNALLNIAASSRYPDPQTPAMRVVNDL